MANKPGERPQQTSEKRRRRRRRRRGLPKGVPGFWARVRRLIWSWWIWVLAAMAAANWRHWAAFWTLLVAFVALMFEPPEQPPTYGLDHEFSVDSEEFLGTIAGATDTPFSLGNQI